MKRVGHRVLTGVLNVAETRNVLNNEAKGLGWLIRDFRIFPNRPAGITTDPIYSYSVRISTTGGLSASSFDFANNTVLGVASYIAGVQSAIFDPGQMITTDLFLENFSVGATDAESECIYQVELELFEITPAEEIVAILKETAQGGENL